jgi:UDP-N-acetylmuramate--alanine ligase
MIKVGIFFGGASREREISFAGGRTVYDNLDKSLFVPVPIFIDSNNKMILLDWSFIYKGTIRDFYPPVSFLPNQAFDYQMYIESLNEITEDEYNALINKVGKLVLPHELHSLIDFGFLALHGAYGEDGSIQGLLQFLKIPYSGAGILSAALGMNKAYQKQLMKAGQFNTPLFEIINYDEWRNVSERNNIYLKCQSSVGNHSVVKPANQGSSVGASILIDATIHTFETAINKAFFIFQLKRDAWILLESNFDKINFIKSLCDIKEGIGLPLIISVAAEDKLIYQPEKLLNSITNIFEDENIEAISLKALDTETTVLVEKFINGKEFSCIVIQDEQGLAKALPPTEIIKGQELFDYRSKYMPGLSRKVTPIQVDSTTIHAIRKECEKLFQFLGFNVYARIDGFLASDGNIFLNDPNTTSGMLPSSFFFHQAAEIGLNPSQFLTYIIRTSLQQRIGPNSNAFQVESLLLKLDQQIQLSKSTTTNKIKVGVIMGGYSSERHISIESGRNIFEKLSASKKYLPIPIFLTGNSTSHQLYYMPVQIMLKDNADDIKEKIINYASNDDLELIKNVFIKITKMFSHQHQSTIPKEISFTELHEMVDVVFIALHGRPGEDGAIQQQLEKTHIPYNGSGIGSSQITINKYDTLQLLKQNGFIVTNQKVLNKADWVKNKNLEIENVLTNLQFPFIAKPIDDGCSSAVKKIKNKLELNAFVDLMFRDSLPIDNQLAALLQLKDKEEFPLKENILFEQLISKEGATHFLEITVGLLTHKTENNTILYEIFEPSEALADGEILSLEEKFLAGQGQNITPARFGNNEKEYKIIVKQVKKVIEDAAKLLNIEGYSRIDAFVRIYDDLKADTIIIEVNSLPGMTPATCIYHQAALNHYKPYDFIDRILDYGMVRKNNN